MKLKQNQSLIQQPTFNTVCINTHLPGAEGNDHIVLTPPNPPTSEAVAKAQFIDKTYNWKGSAANQAADVQPSV